MAFPVLGLLGAAAAVPFYEGYRNRVSGMFNERALNGVDRSDPAAVRSGLFNHGLIGGDQFLASQFDYTNMNQNNQYRYDALAQSQNQFEQNMALQQQQFGLQQRRFAFDVAGSVPTLDGPVDFGSAFDQLVGMESGGNPGAVSPKGAMGFGQIMPANIGPWAREQGLIGADMSDDQAIALYQNNPEFQYQLGANQFKKYVTKYGLRDAYVKWHAGEGTNWQDVVNDYTSGANKYHDGNMHTFEYVNSNMNGYGRRAGIAAAERTKKEQDEAVANFGSPQQQSLYDNPMTTPQTRNQIGSEVTSAVAGQNAYNPNTDEQLQRTMMLNHDEQIRAEQTKAAEAEAGYVDTAQSLVDTAERVDWALENVNTGMLDRDFWSSTENITNRNEINKLLTQQKMEYWNKTLGRSDAPSEKELQALDDMFPLLTPGNMDNTRLAVVSQNLQALRQSINAQLSDADRNQRTQGGNATQPSPRNSLPDGWRVD